VDWCGSVNTRLRLVPWGGLDCRDFVYLVFLVGGLERVPLFGLLTRKFPKFILIY